MSKRIKELKAHYDLTSAELADRIGVSSSTVESWTCGKRNPSKTAIRSMEWEFHLNPGWITGDSDQMLLPDEMREKAQVREIMTCKRDFAVDTVYKLAKASDEDWKTLEKVIK